MVVIMVPTLHEKQDQRDEAPVLMSCQEVMELRVKHGTVPLRKSTDSQSTLIVVGWVRG